MVVPSRDLQQQLADAARRHAEHRRLQAEIARAQAAVDVERHKAARWRREAQRAADRMQYLRSWRPLALLRRWFGGARRELAELSMKVDAARREHDAAEDRKAPLRDEVERLTARLRELGPAAEEHRRLLAEKEQRLGAGDPETADRLARSGEQLARLAADRAALDALIRHGRAAESALLAAKGKLARSAGVGLLDVLGGGSIIGLAKHRGFDDAMLHLRAAERSLREMSAHMANQAEVLNRIDLGVGIKLADLLLDSLPIDLFVQSRIREAGQKVQDALDQLRPAIWAAERRLREVGAMHAEAAAARDAWIEQAC